MPVNYVLVLAKSRKLVRSSSKIATELRSKSGE